MTDQVVRAVEREMVEHGAFRETADGFSVRTTPFDTAISIAASEEKAVLTVTVRVPPIDAVVDGDQVAPVVKEGWFETFERRLEDLDGALYEDPDQPLLSLRPEAVIVEVGFTTSDPTRAVSDAKAVVDYVEGTYVEGIIPGYTYTEPVDGLLDRAAERSGAEDGRPPL